MQRKSKKKQPVAINATAIAARAGCSRQLVSRLLARGFDEQQIIERIAERKAREAARAPRNSGATVGNSGAPANGFPVTPVVPWPTFAESERRKEHLLAELRELQLMRERGELIPTSYVKVFITRLQVEARDILLAGPSELQDVLASESDPLRVNAILRAWVERAMEKFYRCERLWGLEPKDDVA